MQTIVFFPLDKFQSSFKEFCPFLKLPNEFRLFRTEFSLSQLRFTAAPNNF